MTLQDDELLQHDNNEMHALKNQSKVSEDMVVASLVHYDNTHRMVKDLYRKAQKRVEGDWLVADLQVVKTTLESMKSDYLCFLSDGDYILQVVGIYVDQSSKGKNEIMKLNRELQYAHNALDDTQIAFQKVENQVKITNHS